MRVSTAILAARGPSDRAGRVSLARHYEDRRMWQHAINEAQDLHRWTETPNQQGNVRTWIRELEDCRDRVGG